MRQPDFPYWHHACLCRSSIRPRFVRNLFRVQAEPWQSRRPSEAGSPFSDAAPLSSPASSFPRRHRRARADQHRQDPSRDRAHARPRERHDRPAAAAARPRGLRPRRRAGSAPHNVALSPARRRSCRTGRATGSRTVEAMPRDLDLAFVAIDEIQLAADLERGHVFTDRLLNQRGREETLLSAPRPCAPLDRGAVPGVHVVTRPRLSKLTFAGEKKLIAPAAPLRHRRLLGRGGLRHRRADPPPARRRRGGAGRALAAHPQRPGRAVPDRRRRLPRRHRRDRHGPQPRRRPRRLRRPTRNSTASASASSTRPSSARSPAAPAATCATAPSAPRGAARPSSRRSSRRSRTTPSIRCASCNGATRTSTSRRSRRCSESLADQPREHGLMRAPIGEDVRGARASSRARTTSAASRARPPPCERLWEVCQVPDYRKISPAEPCRSRRPRSTAS